MYCKKRLRRAWQRTRREDPCSLSLSLFTGPQHWTVLPSLLWGWLCSQSPPWKSPPAARAWAGRGWHQSYVSSVEPDAHSPCGIIFLSKKPPWATCSSLCGQNKHGTRCLCGPHDVEIDVDHLSFKLLTLKMKGPSFI